MVSYLEDSHVCHATGFGEPNLHILVSPAHYALDFMGFVHADLPNVDAFFSRYVCRMGFSLLILEIEFFCTGALNSTANVILSEKAEVGVCASDEGLADDLIESFLIAIFLLFFLM